jgi:hypothetical protein
MYGDLRTILLFNPARIVFGGDFLELRIKLPTAAQKKKEQKMINDGFRAMYFAHKKDDELYKFKKDIKKKYG